MVKVSRSLKEIAAKAYAVREVMEKKTGKEPTVAEIAEELQITVEDLMLAMEANTQVESLHQVIYQGDGTDISLMDKVEEKENSSETIVDRIFLEEILHELDGKERELIYKRYVKEQTQAAIALEWGISQVQVSRMEKKIMTNLKKKAGG